MPGIQRISRHCRSVIIDMVIIITGAIGIGKSTVCKTVVNVARNHGYSCGGVITSKIGNEDIVIKDILTGKTKDFASTSNDYGGPRTHKYFFNPQGTDFGNLAIEKGIAADILVIDEIGQLELSGHGFTGVIGMISKDKVGNCILVIRKSLLSDYLSFLGAEILVFETTIENRDQIPMQIFNVLSNATTQKHLRGIL